MQRNKNLTSKKLFLLDMDGTIYLGNHIFDGTIAFLRNIKNHGGRYAFMTNNSSKSATAYIEKLAKMGIEATADDFVTSANVTADYLLKNHCSDSIYVMGTKSFAGELESVGLKISKDYSDNVKVLVAGYDTELTYEKLTNACLLLDKGATFIATNPDWVCPTETGFLPDCGCMCQMLEKATGRKPIVIGKPEIYMPNYALRKYGICKEDAVIVGDRLYTDIKCGVNSGIDSAFVLSGEGKLSDIDETGIIPTCIYESVSDIFSSEEA